MDDTAVDEQFEEASGMSPAAHQTVRRVPGDRSTFRVDLGPALAELPTRQRQVLSLRYLAGLDDNDVSEALGISVKAVRKSAAQGIAALHACGAIREDNFLLR